METLSRAIFLAKGVKPGSAVGRRGYSELRNRTWKNAGACEVLTV
jgi:hypothetical protein